MNIIYKSIKTAKWILDFNFIRVYTVDGVRYFYFDWWPLKSYLFYMKKQNRIWTIANKDKFPNWILELEENLEQAIVQNDKT